MKKILIILTLLVLSITLNVSNISASSISKDEKDILEMRKYIQKNVSKLNKEFSMLDQNSNLIDIERVIQEFYEKNPSPLAAMNQSIDITDVFPNLKNEKKNEKLDLNEYVKNPQLGDHSYSFISNKDKIDVLISKTGEITILEKTETPLLVENETTPSIGIYALPWQNTNVERSTAYIYNSNGFKMITLWAEGQFQYNSTAVNSINNDGNWQRHTAGSTLNVSARNLGSTRYAYVGTERYAEVFTRIYFESVYGFRWAGIVMKSATLEVYVGSSKYGIIYGGAKEV